MHEALVRELVARREEPRLDFKEQTHRTNEELAKDIMAMGNILPRGARAHILVGVAEQAGIGKIIGADLGKVGDAEYQEKVKTLLNRVPRFRFISMQVDGLWVGIFEIEGTGERPYYPLKDAAVLRRFVPLKRIGTSTDVASPDEVIGWRREDEPEPQAWHDLRRIQSDARVRVLVGFWMTYGSGRPTAPDGVRIYGRLKEVDEPQGRCTFLMEPDSRQLQVPLSRVGLVWQEGLGWNVEVKGTVHEARGSTQWSFSPETSW